MLKRYWNVWAIALISVIACVGLVLFSYAYSEKNNVLIGKTVSVDVRVNKHDIQLETLQLELLDNQSDPKSRRTWNFVKQSGDKFELGIDRNSVDSILQPIPFFKRPKEMGTEVVKVYGDSVVVVGNKTNTGTTPAVYTYNQTTQESKQIELPNIEGYPLYNSVGFANNTVSFVVNLYGSKNMTQHVKIQPVSVDIVTGEVKISPEQIFENGAYAHMFSKGFVTIEASENERYVYNVATGERITLDGGIGLDRALAIEGSRLYGVRYGTQLVELNLETREERELVVLHGRGDIGIIDETTVMSFDDETQTLYGYDVKTGEVVYQADVSSQIGQKINIFSVSN